MNFTIESSTLLNGINNIFNVVDKKNQRPILTNIFIQITQTSLTLSATDLEISAKIILPIKSEGVFSFCINAKSFFDIVKELPIGTVEIEQNSGDSTIAIKCKNSHFTVLIQQGVDFPLLAFETAQNQLVLPSRDILEIIQRTSHAISLDETRIFLNGIFLQQVASSIRAVATDGFQLALLDKEYDGHKLDVLENGIIIPKKGVQELKRIAEAHIEGKINISINETYLYVDNGADYYISIRLISRDYPKYQAAIPSKTQFKLTADKKVLFEAVKRIRIMSSEKTNGVRLKVSPKNLHLSANHPSLGEASDSIPVVFTGESFEIGVNAKYLMDTLAAFDEGEIIFEFNNEVTPIVVKSPHSLNFLGIVMPLRL